MPGLHDLYRAGIYHAADQVLAPIMRAGWPARPTELVARAHLRRHVRDRELRAKLTPHYRIGEKRILLDNGYYPALTLPHVELVTDPIDRLTPDGIRTVDGTEHHADVIVWATGFRAPEFLAGVRIRGRDKRDLHGQWRSRGRPTAFYGLAVPGFPNLYMIAGPHSFTPSNSNPSVKQHQARYILRCLELSARLGSPIEVTPEAMTTYQQRLDTELAQTVWPRGVRSWFKRSDGQITNPWPGTVREFGRRLELANPAEAFAEVVVEARVSGQDRLVG